MAFTLKIAFKLFFNNLGDCQIGDEGFEYLSRGKWPKIERIWLCLLIIIEMVIRELLWWELKYWEKLRVWENTVSEYNVTVKIYRSVDWGNWRKQQKNAFFSDKHWDDWLSLC
jgi:hypothetical protein